MNITDDWVKEFHASMDELFARCDKIIDRLDRMQARSNENFAEFEKLKAEEAKPSPAPYAFPPGF